MSTILQEIRDSAVKKVPDVKPGVNVRVHQTIKEGEKTRVQIFEGLVIKVNSGKGADSTFTVRKIVDGIGVEKVFPLYSPLLKKIEVNKESKIRRAKLYYMRKRSGKSAKLKETFIEKTEAEKEEAIAELAEKVAQEEAKKEATKAVENPIEPTPENAPSAEASA